jgi:hypothetical protein
VISPYSRANPLLAFIKSVVMTTVNHVSMVQSQIIHQSERVTVQSLKGYKKKKTADTDTLLTNWINKFLSILHKYKFILINFSTLLTDIATESKMLEGGHGCPLVLLLIYVFFIMELAEVNLRDESTGKCN